MSGWELMAVQIVALAIVTPVLWLVGLAFRRARVARWTSMLAAMVAGPAMAAILLLRADEAAVASYLFATCLFVLGTVMTSVFLSSPPFRRRVPRHRGAPSPVAASRSHSWRRTTLLATMTPLKWPQPVRRPCGRTPARRRASCCSAVAFRCASELVSPPS